MKHLSFFRLIWRQWQKIQKKIRYVPPVTLGEKVVFIASCQVIKNRVIIQQKLWNASYWLISPSKDHSEKQKTQKYQMSPFFKTFLFHLSSKKNEKARNLTYFIFQLYINILNRQHLHDITVSVLNRVQWKITDIFV